MVHAVGATHRPPCTTWPAWQVVLGGTCRRSFRPEPDSAGWGIFNRQEQAASLSIRVGLPLFTLIFLIHSDISTKRSARSTFAVLGVPLGLATLVARSFVACARAACSAVRCPQELADDGPLITRGTIVAAQQSLSERNLHDTLWERAHRQIHTDCIGQ